VIADTNLLFGAIVDLNRENFSSLFVLIWSSLRLCSRPYTFHHIHHPFSRPALILSLSIRHYLYADDAQLFFFHHSNLTQASLTCRRLRNQISSSMTPNILTLNSYKTEFLLIRHEETTYTIPHSTLWTLTHSQPHFRRLNFIIFIIFVNFAASDHILILKEQEPSPLFTPNLTTVIFFNWHTLHNLKYLNRLQQIQNSGTRSC